MQIVPDILQRCWFLAGPTAAGKTATALELAERLDGEILSLDSMAIYRGMDIGTAKPTATERGRVRHHLLDIVTPDVDFSVAEYVQRAADICESILQVGKTPIFAGGTGLYLRALLRGVFDGPQADWPFRRELTEREQQAPGCLHRELSEQDPVSAEKLHANDTRRVIRALEVLHLTGHPLSQQQRQVTLPTEQRPRHVFWLHPDRAWLHQRIDNRVLQMCESGLVTEVERLLQQPLGRTARQGLGYKEVISHLEDGLGYAEMIATIQARTRQFAKRQHTWFRNLEECREVQMDGTESPAILAARILECGD